LRQLWRDLKAKGIAEVTEVSPVRRDDLARAVHRYQPDLVQYTGHGWYADGRGVLMLDPSIPGASADLVDSDQVAVALRSARMVVLATCRGAQGPGIEGGSASLLTGVAPALSAAGVPLVVGMQLGVTVSAVHRATHAIYSALADGHSVQAAVGRARDELYVNEPERRSWYVPVLYVRTREAGAVLV
jgi:CHAT domain-containing protein